MKCRKMNVHGTRESAVWEISDDSEEGNCVRYIYWRLFPIIRLHCAYVEARVDLMHTVDFSAHKQPSTTHRVKSVPLRRGGLKGSTH
jgi:hypothetical protein